MIQVRKSGEACLEVARQLADRLAAVVHEGHGLGQQDALAAEPAAAERCAVLQLVQAGAQLARQLIYQHEAYLCAHMPAHVTPRPAPPNVDVKIYIYSAV